MLKSWRQLIIVFLLANLALAPLAGARAEEGAGESAPAETAAEPESPAGETAEPVLPLPEEVLPENPAETEAELPAEEGEIGPQKISPQEELEPEASPMNLLSTNQSASAGGFGYQAANLNNFCPNCNLTQSNGSLNYAYKLDLPAGRNGLTPEISLSYSQLTREMSSIAGFGWTLDSGPYIERSGRKGSRLLYSLNEFKFVSGPSAEMLLPVSLTDATHGQYGLRAEESFSNYQFLADNSWKITDKKGVKYYFGLADNSRLSNPADSSQIFRWQLAKVEDANGNNITYSYFKDGGYIYPREIKYTNFGAEAGAFGVRFEPFYSGNLTERPDKQVSYFPGFAVDVRYRLDKIVAGAVQNGTWQARKEYRLAFVNQENTKKYNLASIEEAGWNGSSWNVMPKLEFQYYNTPTTWTVDSSQLYHNLSLGGYLLDINADGLEDKVDLKTKQVYLNNGVTGWELIAGNWRLPEANWNSSYFRYAITDINGDNYKDLIFRDYINSLYKYSVYLHNGVNGWDYSSNSWINVSEIFRDETIKIDVDNDGYLDYLQNPYSTANSSWIFIFNGTNGWKKEYTNGYDISAYWETPTFFVDEMIQTDINGDNLLDFVYKSTYTDFYTAQYYKHVYLNSNSKGWKLDSIHNWQIPDNVGIPGFVTQGVDFNNDRQDDFVVRPESGPFSYLYDTNAYYSNGINGWEGGSGYIPGYYAQRMDVNNDGWDDYYEYYGGPPMTIVNRVSLNSGTNSFFLKNIKNNRGGEIKLEYQNAKSFRDESGQLANPKIIQDRFLAKKVSYFDRGEEIGSASYHYYGGLTTREVSSDPWTNSFAGFSKIKTTDKAGNYMLEYFHQGGGFDGASLGEYSDHFSKKGKIYRTEIYNSAGQRYQAVINKYDQTSLGNGRYFAKLARSTQADYDGGATAKAETIEYTYEDTYGNLTQAIDWGEVALTDNAGNRSDLAQDKITWQYEYAHNNSGYIHNLVSREKKFDKPGARLMDKRHYYDQLPAGQAAKGNLTKTEAALDAAMSAYVSEQTEYNSYGLPTRKINGRGYATVIVYDQYNLFPAQITNAKAQTTSYKYDLFSGTAVETTDPNGAKTAITLDAFGRIKEEKISPPASPASLLLKTSYVYNDTAIPNAVTKTEFNQNSANSYDIITVSYQDGFGRLIQTRQEAEGSNQFAVSSQTYDQSGQIKKKFLPKLESGSAFSTIVAADQGEEFAYDAIGRITSAKTALGETKTAYDDWKQTVTDPLGKKKDLLFDARGSLIEVGEYLAGTRFVTSYIYDANDNLIRLTDAKGNLRNFTYDLLGRRLTNEDLHVAGDTTFGVWSYQYDANGNLTKKTDPKGQVVNYAYDDLDRVSSEDFAGQAGVEESYTYDQGPSAIGRLSAVTLASSSKQFAYDILGRKISEKATIAGTLYETKYTYDLLGNITSLTYPYTTLVNYQYNNSGQLNSIVKGQLSIVNNIDYSPTGQIAKIENGNGTITTNIYDYAKLYRLTNKKTMKGTAVLQNISYEYDAVGNITKLIDASPNKAAKTAVYAYDDLYRLTGATITNAANSQNYTQTYSYDILGNILTKSDIGNYEYAGGVSATAAGTRANPHAVTKVGSAVYAYDNNGNLTNDSVWTHTWDYQDRISRSTKSGSVVSYAYDESGQRILKTENGAISVYPNQYYDLDNGTKNRHIFAGGLRVATIQGDEAPAGCLLPTSGDWTVSASCTLASSAKAPGNVMVNAGVVLTIASGTILEINLKTNKLLVKQGGGVLVKKGGTLRQTTTQQFNNVTIQQLIFHHADHLSGSNIETDANGAVIEVLDYFPFGSVRLDEKAGGYANKYKYTGKELDGATGLYYYGARYYNGSIGRFVSIDPLANDLGTNKDDFKRRYGKELLEILKNPQELNSYSYVLNNPLNSVDPNGESGWSIVGKMFSGVVGKVTGPLGIAYDLLKPTPTSPSIQDMSGNAIAGQTDSQQNFGVSGMAISGTISSQYGKGTDLLNVGEKNYSVYVSYGKDGAVDYVGITNNFDRRADEWARQNRYIREITGLSDLTRNQARGVEQSLIEHYGFEKYGGTLTNKINSISVNNKIYEVAKDFGTQLLKSIKYIK